MTLKYLEIGPIPHVQDHVMLAKMTIAIELRLSSSN